MIRKIGQIIRRGPSTWLVRIYVGRDPEMLRRKYIGSAFTVVCALLRPTSTACSLSGILDATSVLDGKPSASTSIAGPTPVLARGCGPRASTTTRVIARYVRSRLRAKPGNLVRDQGVGGSNPLSPTIFRINRLQQISRC